MADTVDKESVLAVISAMNAKPRDTFVFVLPQGLSESERKKREAAIHSLGVGVWGIV